MTLFFQGSTSEGDVVFASADGKSVARYRTLALAREAAEVTGNTLIGGDDPRPLSLRRIAGPCGVFASGQVFVFDGTSEQIDALQKPLLVLWAERAEALGFEPDGVVFQDHIGRHWRIVRREGGGFGTDFVE